jgi:CTP synthase (UTP-ammonia lyase)
MARIAVIGDYDPASPTHGATEAALQHSTQQLGAQVEHAWLSTQSLSDALFAQFAAVLIAPGSPYKDMARTLAAIRFAREHGVPCLGTCGGFQHMIIEYARNVLGMRDAQHAEYDPNASDLFITPLSCSLRGRSMTLQLTAGSQVAAVYGSTSATEQYYCNFGVNPARVALLKSGPLRITGSDSEGELRVIELPGHPFFIGTLFVPQVGSRAGQPHPLVTAFVRAALAQTNR